MTAEVFSVLFGLYIAAGTIFLVSENRRPQSTFAWVLLLFALPGVGLVIYVLFGREQRTFGRPPGLVRHDLDRGPEPLASVLAAQEGLLRQLEEKHDPRARLAKLVHYNSHSALTRQNELEILQNAEEHYPRLIDDLRNAKTSINLQFYSWGSDRLGVQLKDILVAKVAQGVSVRLLYDPLGSLLLMKPSYRRALQRGGVQVHPTSRLYRLHTISYRNHRKIAIIDGVIGYTGGMNIGQEHIDGGRAFDGWRDTQVRFVGDAAMLLQAVFAVDWKNAVGEDLFQDKRLVRAPAEDCSAGVPIQITVSGPDSRWRAIRQLYFALITSARQHVYLQSPFFIIDETIAEALKSAALSGVDVQIMLSDKGAGLGLAYWAGYTYVAEVAAAGAKVFFYRRDIYFHPKTMSIDSDIFTVGSANMDIRSFSINYELNAVIYDNAKTLEFERDFLRDKEDCEPFSLDAYRNSSRLLRFRDSAARLLSPLL